MSGLDVVFAAEYLVPPVGGAELFALELLQALGERGHRVRAAYLGDPGSPAADVEATILPEPDPAPGYWRTKRLRREAVGEAVRAALAERPADVVVTQLHAAPAAVAAGVEAGAATAVSLVSYESLCKYAFDGFSRCSRARDCRTCPAALALPAAEREELLRSRREHARSLASANALLAVSRAVAAAAAGWCGRQATVVYPVLGKPPAARADPEGPVVAIARWNPHKGDALLAPVAAALPHRRFRVVDSALRPERAAALRGLANVDLVRPAPVARLVDGASVVVVPSQWDEPFGRVAYQAQAAGVPVLASDAGGLREQVPAAQLVRPRDDVAAWVAALRALEEHARWEAAREAALSAARAALETDPLGTTERLLTEAARARALRG